MDGVSPCVGGAPFVIVPYILFVLRADERE